MATPRTGSGRLSRRRLLAATGAAAAAGVLPACGRRTPSGDGPLQVWGGVPAESGPADLIKDFERSHPGTKINYTRYVNDERGNLKLDSALQGGVDIDIYFTYLPASLALRSESGLTADLTDRVRADPELAPFLDRRQPRAFWSGDRIHGLATTREPNFVLINEKLRRRAGAELPTAWTIEDYRDYARRLTTDRTAGAYTVPDVARIALGSDYWYTADGRSNFGDPHFLQGLRLGQQMIAEGSLYPWREVLARQLDAYQQNAFLAGDFAIWPTAPFNLRYLNDDEEYAHDFRVSCAPVPTVSGGGDWDTGTYGNFIMINPTSRRQDLAWEFARHWVTEGAAPMITAGKMPALDTVDPETVLTGLLGQQPDKHFDVDSFHRVLVDQHPKLVMDTELSGYPEIELAYSQQRDLCWLEEKAPEAAIAEAEKLADAAIRRDIGTE
ncbi:ABC transporter substrate-binding protein [Microlunatus soli]|uniref:Carbohydrate ABC transporter substrate-binding protein, CUT1 family n=1 Tax=Microlunatus soli TaxID=630515 RepID=A0A1H1YDM4_9ACTN|nr:extracellular solute-binding protein [Microlunatus soli]SDT19379.1 carbohydrate ABC transporter substrate-binding protein, CUT1 family [Microlunatus soli]